MVVVDMWDGHWCKTVANRLTGLAPRLNRFLGAARNKGALIIFMLSPSTYHGGHPRQKAMGKLARVTLPSSLDLDFPTPFQGKNLGCECVLGSCTPCKGSWNIHPDVKVDDHDFIGSKQSELYGLCRMHNITSLLYVGGSANKCVLYRPFGVIPMLRLGLKCFLIGDLTISTFRMPFREEYHRQVLDHVNKHIAPVFSATDVLSGDFHG